MPRLRVSPISHTTSLVMVWRPSARAWEDIAKLHTSPGTSSVLLERNGHRGYERFPQRSDALHALCERRL